MKSKASSPLRQYTCLKYKESCRDIERGDSWFEEVESYSDFFFQLIMKRL